MSNHKVAPVVVAVDGSEASLGAIRYGAVEARERGSQVHLVHVEPSYLPMTPVLPFYPGDVESLAQEILEIAARQVHEVDPRLEVVTTVGIGPTAHQVVHAAVGAGLVVVGRESRHGVDRWWHGATAARVAARAATAVVAVPHDWTPEQPLHGRVVVGLRTTTHADELLAHAFATAAARDAVLCVVHAWDLPDPYLDRIEQRTHGTDWREDGRRLVEEAVAHWRLAYPDVTVEVRVEHGPAAAVLSWAAEDADLLVLVRHDTALRSDGHLGSTARALLGSCPRPVVVHPAGTAPAEPPLTLERSGSMVR